jgi:5-formyltetrahydrofolate cyclo-ligase
MTNAPDPKGPLRRQAFDARKAAFAEAGAHVPRATAHLLERIGPAGLAASSRATCRSGPRSTRLPAMAALHGAGARSAVPVIAGAGLPLDFREWTPELRLVEGPFKALGAGKR